MDAGADIMDAHSAASVLDWWREAGVDVLVDETPRDWLSARHPDAVAAPAEAARETQPTSPKTFNAFRPWLESAASLPDR